MYTSDLSQVVLSSKIDVNKIVLSETVELKLKEL